MTDWQSGLEGHTRMVFGSRALLLSIHAYLWNDVGIGDAISVLVQATDATSTAISITIRILPPWPPPTPVYTCTRKDRGRGTDKSEPRNSQNKRFY